MTRAGIPGVRRPVRAVHCAQARTADTARGRDDPAPRMGFTLLMRGVHGLRPARRRPRIEAAGHTLLRG